MGNLYYRLDAFVSADGQRFDLEQEDYTITSIDNVYNKTFDVANNTTQKLFDTTLQGAFKICFIQSDHPMHIELVTDDDATNGEMVFTIYSPGSGITGIMGPRICLPSNVSYANYTVNFGGGTVDTIDTIRCRNISGSAGRIRIFAGQT